VARKRGDYCLRMVAQQTAPAVGRVPFLDLSPACAPRKQRLLWKIGELGGFTNGPVVGRFESYPAAAFDHDGASGNCGSTAGRIQTATRANLRVRRRALHEPSPRALPNSFWCPMQVIRKKTPLCSLCTSCPLPLIEDDARITPSISPAPISRSWT